MIKPLDTVLAQFPRERQWLLPALQAVQHAHGWLSEDALTQVAAHLRVPATEVYGVATHFPELHLAPHGRHHVRVCTGVSCALLGGRQLLAKLTQRFDAAPGAPDADREVTLEAADCFFACSMAPAIEVDGEYRGRVSESQLADLESWFSHRRRHGSPSPMLAMESAVPKATASARAALADLATLAHAKRGFGIRVIVQTGTCGRSVGADTLLEPLRAGINERGLDADLIEGACNGMCYAAPLVEIVTPESARFVVERLQRARVPALLDALAGEPATWPAAGMIPLATHPFFKSQHRVLLARAGAVDPDSLDDALVHGAYSTLARALDGSPDDVIAQVKASGLQGRGGAFFPTALKWEACRKAAGEPKYMVMNGEEGEPGIFKDRHLMEGDPHQILEGVLLAAYAAGASRAILYIHGEADLSAQRLNWAVVEARAAPLVGERVLGSGFRCEVEIRRGAGGFVLGEETALLESIEGRRAQPRTRPPFPVEAGLWGRPTVINNVETLSAIPTIVARGGAAFAALGTSSAPGTKVFGLSGPVRRPGVVETKNGVTLNQLLRDLAGGSLDGRPLKGALVGGPSGSVVPAALFDVAMEPRGRVSPGTGGIVAVPAGASIIDIVKTLLAFNARESCGKCTPCREGLPRLLALLDEGDSEQKIRELGETIQLASLCGLGQAAPIAVQKGFESFGDELRARR
ncbi:MAG: hypothetical protein AUG80_09765 [Candidatus Rokubacteria bacterium 13_1_20CM_4_68_9]|nr:MAG: hypothetical protein AUG80_09765 [Candidatus Rokubacteria bacterium 13_1_20CM_4_68_9]